MFRYRRALPGGFRTRLGVFAGGQLIACYGASLFSRGIFVFHITFELSVLAGRGGYRWSPNDGGAGSRFVG